MSKLIGYARVSTRKQGPDRQIQDLIDAGVHRDDLYVDHGVSWGRDFPSGLDQALEALRSGDTLVVTTLDRLGRPTITLPALTQRLRGRDAHLRALNLGGREVDTATPTGSILLSVIAGLAQMDSEIGRERILDVVAKRRMEGKALGGRPRIITQSQVRVAVRLLEAGESAAQVARDLGISQATLYRRVREFRRNESAEGTNSE